ncbi:MAG TPA: hypothetical protein DIW61_05580 [Candidatus Aminicenantes bacterium]|nr:hypothetical protein [Candidatus Aminicenantes bacterium]
MGECFGHFSLLRLRWGHFRYRQSGCQGKSYARLLGGDPDHLRNFIRKYYQRDGLESLTRKEPSSLIESLKAIRAREPRTRKLA